MQFVADLHLHSKYSRAVSQNMILPVMADFARKKGIDIISTGDFTHPLWIREIQSQLKESGEGLYRFKDQGSKIKDENDVLFLLSTEIASIYTQGEKLRRIHNLIFSPSIEICEKINKELTRRGCNLHSDGRPIIGLSSKNLLEIVSSIDPRAILIPCHIWTPHFGIYGSASGFGSLDEAFGDSARFVYGIETGLSSDPLMNWQVEELDNRSILSFSDAHSPAKMGREATVFVSSKNGISNDKLQISNEEITYEDIRLAIMRRNGKLKIGYTIEFYPEEGKYHFSGHRNCGVVYGPEDLKAKGEICPVCHRRLTEGVLNRVMQLSTRLYGKVFSVKMSDKGIKWYIDQTKNHPPFVKLVPLLEIIAEAMHSTVSSRKVTGIYDMLCSSLGSEFNVLLLSSVTDIEKYSDSRIAQAISKVREGNIIIDPGYDGEYGKVKIERAEEKIQGQPVREMVSDERQLGLF
ncbi:endonuclease Q family protein [Patescibacteria group bacterium]|nr:endonuclease Q family protein [Patescibacteria group bacterium]MCL5010002.1 endonuclease Q family protein [Patescibacteria group bacterium]